MRDHDVPPDLIPMFPKEYTKQWARDTYQFKKAFCHLQVGYIPTDDDISSWIRIARDIGEDLKRLGLSRAKKRIVDMMNEFFCKKTVDGRPFQNLCDVCNWLSLETNYRSNYEETLNMLHMFQYGIFRRGNNSWALEEASHWMDKRNIHYITKAEGKSRQGKGFVYRLLVSRASNTLCTRFQALTQRCHDEYIIVRDRTVQQDIPGHIVQKHVFNHLYKGAIVRLPRKKENKNMFTNEEFKELNSLLCEA